MLKDKIHVSSENSSNYSCEINLLNEEGDILDSKSVNFSTNITVKRVKQGPKSEPVKKENTTVFEKANQTSYPTNTLTYDFDLDTKVTCRSLCGETMSFICDLSTGC